jgi:hypothetical protein
MMFGLDVWFDMEVIALPLFLNPSRFTIASCIFCLIFFFLFTTRFYGVKGHGSGCFAISHFCFGMNYAMSSYTPFERKIFLALGIIEILTIVKLRIATLSIQVL